MAQLEIKPSPQNMKQSSFAATSQSRLSIPSPASIAKDGPPCQYTHRTCLQSCLSGYGYCIRHILEDKTAPYRQCAYTTKTGRRCPSAAPKLDKKEGLCSSHTRRALLARQRLARKRRPGETGETLLEELVAFTSSGSGSQRGQGEVQSRRKQVLSDSIASRALEYASSSDSESELYPLVDQTWRDDGDSDAESLDSDQEDLLKYAGVYTEEEVSQLLRDKLIRLQALYLDQIKQLRRRLVSCRRRYLREKRADTQAFGSMKLYKNDPTQKEKYFKLKALLHYHKKHGKEALLQKQSTLRRMAMSSSDSLASPSLISAVTPVSAPAASPALSCVFTDDGVYCGARVVPLSRHCQKHILHDPHQLLYRACPFADSQCGRPVPSLFNSQFCSLHQASVDAPTQVKEEATEPDVKPNVDSLDPPLQDMKTGCDPLNPQPTHQVSRRSRQSSTDSKTDVKPDLNSLVASQPHTPTENNTFSSLPSLTVPPGRARANSGPNTNLVCNSDKDSQIEGLNDSSKQYIETMESSVGIKASGESKNAHRDNINVCDAEANILSAANLLREISKDSFSLSGVRTNVNPDVGSSNTNKPETANFESSATHPNSTLSTDDDIAIDVDLEGGDMNTGFPASGIIRGTTENTDDLIESVLDVDSTTDNTDDLIESVLDVESTDADTHLVDLSMCSGGAPRGNLIPSISSSSSTQSAEDDGEEAFLEDDDDLEREVEDMEVLIFNLDGDEQQGR